MKPAHVQQPVRGNPAWYFKTVRWQFFCSLHADLKEHNPHGFKDDSVCPSVKRMLQTIVTTATAASHNAFLSKNFASRLGKIATTYGQWNDHQVGEDGRIARQDDHKLLGKLKEGLREACAEAAVISDPQKDQEVFDRFWSAFEELAQKHRSYFPNLNNAVVQSKRIASAVRRR